MKKNLLYIVLYTKECEAYYYFCNNFKMSVHWNHAAESELVTVPLSLQRCQLKQKDWDVCCVLLQEATKDMLWRLIKVIHLFIIIYTDKKIQTEFDIMKPKSKWKNWSYHM